MANPEWDNYAPGGIRRVPICFVYVAGPLSVGPWTQNVATAIRAAELLLSRGKVPFVPHLNVVWDLVYPHTHAEWLEWCLAWLERCDAVLRLPGESVGADMEAERAEELGLPVFGLNEVRHWPRMGLPSEPPRRW